MQGAGVRVQGAPLPERRGGSSATPVRKVVSPVPWRVLGRSLLGATEWGGFGANPPHSMAPRECAECAEWRRRPPSESSNMAAATRASRRAPRRETGAPPVVYQLNGFRKSTPPQSRQLIVLISDSKQKVDHLVGELTF